MSRFVIKNIIANYLGKIWGFVSVYVFVPIYVNLLGIEAYGIINFYSVFLAVLFIADSGLSATLNREMARNEDSVKIGKILKTIEIFYYFISFFVIIVVFLLSHYISSHWLSSSFYSKEDVELMLRLMGISIAFQLLMNLYCSGLMGREHQVLANNIQIFNSLFRGGVVILLLYQWRDIYAYFYWQIAVNIVFFIYARHKLWCKLGIYSSDFKVDKSILYRTLGFTLGMMGMSVISGLNTQLDKLIISNLLDLKTYGEYALASIFGQVCSMVTLPIALSILPKMTRMFEYREGAISRTFHTFSYLITFASSTATMVLVLYTESFIFLWTKDMELSSRIADTSRLLLIGGFFLSLQFMPYYTAIANGYTRTNLRLGAFMLCIIPLLTYWFVNQYGMIGGGVSWVILNVLAFIILGVVIIKKFLNMQDLKDWFLRDTLIPVLFSGILFYGFYLFKPNNYEGYTFIVLSFLFVLLQLIFNSVYFFKFYNHNLWKKI